jgi:hypothetical protein
MSHRDDVAMRRAALLKAARSMIRLRHSLAADAELNDVLPRVEAEFDKAVQMGTLPEVAGLLSKFVSDPR